MALVPVFLTFLRCVTLLSGGCLTEVSGLADLKREDVSHRGIVYLKLPDAKILRKRAAEVFPPPLGK